MTDTDRALIQARQDIERYANRRMADPYPPAGSLHGAMVMRGTRAAVRTRRIEVAL